MSRLAVVYDFGSASATEIVQSLRADYDLLFLIPHPLQQDQAIISLLSRFGTVVMKEADGWPWQALVGMHIEGVVTFSELCLAEAAAIAERLDLEFCTPHAALSLRDKSRQRLALAAGGVDDVPHATVEDLGASMELPDRMTFPVVIKPRQGAASESTYLVGSSRELERHLGLVNDPIVEQYVPARTTAPWGDIVSVETFSWAGGRTHLPPTGRFEQAAPFRSRGTVIPAPARPHEEAEMRSKTERALDALGFTSGITHTEFKLSPTGPRLIEVNGRLGGTIHPLAKAAFGIDMIKAAADIAVGSFTGIRTPPMDGYAFVFHTLPPASARAVRAVPVRSAMRDVEGVQAYSVHVRPGETLKPYPIAHWLDSALGRVGSSDEVFAVVEQIQRRARYGFDDAG